MNKNGKIERYDVWDVATDEMKLQAFPVVVQAMYNAMIALEAEHGDNRYYIRDDELQNTIWDLRNVNKMLHSMGIKSTFTKIIRDDSSVSLKHITNDVKRSLLSAFENEIDARKKKWVIEHTSKEAIENIDLRKKIKDLKTLLCLKTNNEEGCDNE